ncbi:MAG: ABC transporter ATP-binding protein [Bauldia sp.]
MSSSVLLSISNVAKSYGKTQALRGVSLSVGEGEFVALLGQNGAGKSTLLQLLTGLFSPDSGSIFVLGHDLQRSAIKALREIGVVFQQPTLDLELTVSANLLFHTDLHGIDRRTAKSRISEALTQFGLAERAGDRVKALSGGNRRRVELARALLHEPRVLFMDEATVGLDPGSRRDLVAHIQRLKREKKLGILWTTHLVDEAEQADRLFVLHRGQLLYDGTPANFVNREGTKNLGEAFLRMTAQGNQVVEEV